MAKFLGTVYETISINKLRFSTNPGGSVSSGQLVEIMGDGKKIFRSSYIN